MKKRVIYILAVIFCGLWGCESLEDTYADYAGDGLLRYVGKCSDVQVKPQWESVELTWKNATEPGIDSVKIVWSANGVIKDTLLPKGTTSCVISPLGDFTYTFQIYAMDVYKNLSVDEIVYGRPYTMTHEALTSFTSVVSKQIPVGEATLLLYLDASYDNLEEAVLHYTRKSSQETDSLVLYGEVEDEKINLLRENVYLLEDVDFTKKVTVARKGKIDSNIDMVIRIPDFVLDMETPLFNNDFLAYVCEYLDVTELTNEMRKEITELSFDFSISSLEDILYFPNLKKLYIGGRRYLPEDAYIDEYGEPLASLYNKENSLYALELAASKLGLDIVEYNDLYFVEDYDFITDIHAYAELPVHTYFSTDDWKVNVTPIDDSGYPSHLEYLTDGDVATNWAPNREKSQRKHVIEIDMSREEAVKGFKVVQVRWWNEDELAFMPGFINIEVSKDRMAWTHVKEQQNIPLGRGDGETTLILLPDEVSARYVRFSVYDGSYYSWFGCNLAEFSIIKE